MLPFMLSCNLRAGVISPAPHEVLCDKFAWIAAALAEDGHEIQRIHALADVAAADEAFDVLLFDHKHAGVNWNSLAELGRSRSRRSLWIQWWRDLVATDASLPLARQPNMLAYGKVMREMDVVLVKERSLLNDFRQCGINARWFDQACPAEMPVCEHSRNPQWDVLVWGSISYKQRYDDVRLLIGAGYRVLWMGLADSVTVPEGCDWRPWAHPIQELPQLASRCATALGVDWRSDLPGYTSDRSYLAAGMGACYLARCANYGDHAIKHFPAAQLAAWIYDSPESLVQVVRIASGDYAERKRRGEQSRRLVMGRHTYQHRCRELCDIIAESQGKRLVQAAGLTC